MSIRTLRLDPQYKEKVERALISHGYSSLKNFAENINMARSTVSNFFNSKPIYTINFTEICHQLDIDWEEVADLENRNAANIRSYVKQPSRREEIVPGQARLILVMDDDENRDIVNQIKRDQLELALRQISGYSNLKIKSMEFGSIVLVVEGSIEGCERIESLFKSGQLTELLGLEILDVGLESAIAPPIINLTQWLQNNFAEAIETGWLTLEEIFGPKTKTAGAFRSQAVKRAKQIQLGDIAINLMIDIDPQPNQEINIFLGVYPATGSATLPDKLHIAVVEETGILWQESATESLHRIEQAFGFEIGDRFWLDISLDEFSHREDFQV